MISRIQHQLAFCKKRRLLSRPISQLPAKILAAKGKNIHQRMCRGLFQTYNPPDTLHQGDHLLSVKTFPQPLQHGHILKFGQHKTGNRTGGQTVQLPFHPLFGIHPHINGPLPAILSAGFIHKLESRFLLLPGQGILQIQNQMIRPDGQKPAHILFLCGNKQPGFIDLHNFSLPSPPISVSAPEPFAPSLS